MEDGQTTVSMSLKRFKELESYEQVFNALRTNEDFIWYNAWNYDGYVVAKTNEAPAKLVAQLKRVVEERDKAYLELREYKSNESDRKRKGGFFS